MHWQDLIGTITCADCMDILPAIPAGAVDLLLTDPPYGDALGAYDTAHRFGSPGSRFEKYRPSPSADGGGATRQPHRRHLGGQVR